MHWRYDVTGVDTVTLHFGERIDLALVERIQQAAEALQGSLTDRLLDAVPSYTTLLLRYDLLQDDLASLMADVAATLNRLPAEPAPRSAADLIEVPVWYDLRVGPDLPRIARQAGLTVPQVIELHCSQPYHVFAIGFAPGFAYLGEVPAQLATPRLATPRAKVPAGTLGIADTQTALYPMMSPGGWNLIGRTPLTLFDPQRTPASFLNAGQQVRFRAIDAAEYRALGGRVDDLPWQSGGCDD
ncbi:5-oxoprolinase subunit PxpB [Marinobacter sp. X15-166B]|uniref:5-oxoprolinase subunit PxpB n=1 Tax=Marinobacter sp. X15-166B TaxID=1897620 RepID=UPI00085C496F|nr:5-oxoprolinase subunit PxpB [Marinobacter sp. X15-166B]OEY65648.1 kinase [Marinobacter sp. X15-166B]